MTVVDHLLILAPQGRDARVISDQLAADGIVPIIASAAEIVEYAGAGQIGAAIITDEAMATFDLTALSGALAAQPAWSDAPFLVLTRKEFGGWTRAKLANLLGNVTMLERPLHKDILVSSVRSALRARQRQRRAESYLLAHAAAEAQLSELAAKLEMRVEERTEALSRALAEREHTQVQLRDSEEVYRHTIELTGQTPWTVDATGDLITIGPGWANPTGSAIADWRSMVHDEDVGGMLAAWQVATTGASPFMFDFRILLGDGRLSWCRSRAAPRLAADGSIIRWYGTLEDIDEQSIAAQKLRQMQAELIHVSRLSAMGTMASTLAHELNQPLTAITNYVRGSRRLLAGHPALATVDHGLEAADRNAVRAGEIIRRIRDQVTKGEVPRRPTDLSDLIHEASSLAMIDARESGIDLRVDLDCDPFTVLVDRIQIQQVLLNLLRNAAEAIAGSSLRRIAIKATARSPHLCQVAVCDTGPGISEECAKRLFDPFNTSKSDGMGIGLSISKTIIEAHGGEIWHEPAPGGGAIFGFSLVRASA